MVFVVVAGFSRDHLSSQAKHSFICLCKIHASRNSTPTESMFHWGENISHKERGRERKSVCCEKPKTAKHIEET